MVKTMMKDWRFWCVLIYVMFSLIFGLIYRNGLLVFLGWNMILAAVVYGLSFLYVHVKKQKKNMLSWIDRKSVV